MKKIELKGEKGSGKFALVDDEDYPLLTGYTWWLHKTGYVFGSMPKGRFGKKNGVVRGREYVQMHRVIMKCQKCTPLIDHINHNKMDNQKSNLRFCTPKENARNQLPSASNKSLSAYKGVTRVGDKWVARIKTDEKQIHLGTFKEEVEAAIAYNNAATKEHGRFAHINNIT